MAENEKDLRRVVTGPKTRWSYVNVWTPKAVKNGIPKYSVLLLIPKSDTVTVDKIRKAIKAAYEEGLETLKGKSRVTPSLEEVSGVLKDGDTGKKKGNPDFAGMYYLNANSKFAPGIVDATRQPIIDQSEVYSGVYGRASVTFYAFNTSGNKGIACWLNNLQKTSDGEPLVNRVSPEEDFGDDEEEEARDFDDFLG